MIENTKRETITRTKAAEILGCSYQGVYQYIAQGKLTEAPEEADGLKRVYLDSEIFLERVAGKLPLQNISKLK